MDSFLLSQLLIAVAGVFDVLSFQFRSRAAILFCLVLSASLISAHFFVLGNSTARGLAFIAAVRFFVAYHWPSDSAMRAFFAVNILCFLYTYATPVNLLPFVGTTVGTWASFRRGDKAIRQALLVASSLWLAHNIIVYSPGAILLEATFVMSNLVGLYRFYGNQDKTVIQSPLI